MPRHANCRPTRRIWIRCVNEWMNVKSVVYADLPLSVTQRVGNAWAPWCRGCESRESAAGKGYVCCCCCGKRVWAPTGGACFWLPLILPVRRWGGLGSCVSSSSLTQCSDRPESVPRMEYICSMKTHHTRHTERSVRPCHNTRSGAATFAEMCEDRATGARGRRFRLRDIEGTMRQVTSYALQRRMCWKKITPLVCLHQQPLWTQRLRLSSQDGRFG